MATPCSAPFVGTAIAFAFTQSNLTMISIFAFMGLLRKLNKKNKVAKGRIIALGFVNAANPEKIKEKYNVFLSFL